VCVAIYFVLAVEKSAGSCLPKVAGTTPNVCDTDTMIYRDIVYDTIFSTSTCEVAQVGTLTQPAAATETLHTPNQAVQGSFAPAVIQGHAWTAAAGQTQP
jgi:hypothetical protein